jgi:hypothetical protein
MKRIQRSRLPFAVKHFLAAQQRPADTHVFAQVV